MFIIRLALSVLFMITLTACGGGDGDGGGGTSSDITIVSADIIDANGSKITSLPMDGSGERFELRWQTNTSDMYYIEFFAGTAASPYDTKLLGRTCAEADPGGLYGCNETGRNWCEVTATNRVSCELDGTRPQTSAPDGNATRLTVKACVFGFLDDKCSSRTIDVQLLQPMSAAPGKDDPVPPSSDDPGASDTDGSGGSDEPDAGDPTPPETKDPTVPGDNADDNKQVETDTSAPAGLEAENLVPPAVPLI